MRIIISPAKKMVVDTDTVPVSELGIPAFIDRAEEIVSWLKSLSYGEQKKLWACSDSIAQQNRERLAHINLRERLTPALLAYDGIQYNYMAPAVFEDGEIDWVQEHVCILSGLYGVLKPMDGVTPYRLEMQAKATVAGCTNLYDYWGDSLAREVMGDDTLLVDLASKEYSRAVVRHLSPEQRCITCIFGELIDERVVQKGVYVKMARGEMVRYLASIHAESPDQLRDYSWSGYAYNPAQSSEDSFVFTR